MEITLNKRETSPHKRPKGLEMT